MKCLITGAFGFLGRNVINTCLQSGIEIIGLDRYIPDWALDLKGVTPVRGDFGEKNQVAPLLDGVDAVLHMACTQFPAESNKDPVFDITSNIGGSVQLLELCVTKGVKRFLFMSSGGTVYGIPRATPIPEDHPKIPDCSYGIAKMTVEHYMRLFHNLHGLTSCAIRLANPYGPYQNPHSTQGAVAVFVRKILHGETIDIWGDGSVRRDFIYVGDFARAVIDLFTNTSVNGPINIGSGVSTSINELISELEQVIGRKADVRYLPSRGFDVPINYLDTSRIRRELDWQPAVSLEEGLRRTVEWQKNNI